MCRGKTKEGKRCKNKSIWCHYHKRKEETENICGVCREIVIDIDDEDTSYRLACNHCFHINCIKNCCENNINTCPICRGPIYQHDAENCGVDVKIKNFRENKNRIEILIDNFIENFINEDIENLCLNLKKMSRILRKL